MSILPSVRTFGNIGLRTLEPADVTDIALTHSPYKQSKKKQPNLPIPKFKPHPANSMESVTGTNHLLIQSRLDHQRHQKVCPNTTRNLLGSSLLTPQLHPTKYRATPSSSLALASLAASAFEVSYNPSHSTLRWPVLPRDLLATLPAKRESNIKKDDRDRRQRPLCPGPHFAKNRRFHNSRQQS